MECENKKVGECDFFNASAENSNVILQFLHYFIYLLTYINNNEKITHVLLNFHTLDIYFSGLPAMVSFLNSQTQLTHQVSSLSRRIGRFLTIAFQALHPILEAGCRDVASSLPQVN